MRNTVRSLFLALLFFAATARAVSISGSEWNVSNDIFGTTSFVQVLWDSTSGNMLPRAEHTAIWRYKPSQQTGYYAVFWHAPNNGAWDYGVYSSGAHPWPGDDCTVNGSGQGLTGNAGSSVHCWEIAGTGGTNDYLATPGVSPGVAIVAGVWYTQIKRVRPMASGPCAGSYEHRFIPDYYGNPSFEIVQCGTIGAPAGGNPANYIGVSDWSTNGSGGSEETLYGVIRGVQFYSDFLSDSDAGTEAGNQLSNTPQTSAGIAGVWYMNQNPIPTDWTDKSGQGHNPTWGNANRPIQWDSTITIPNRWGIFGNNDMFQLKAGF